MVGLTGYPNVGKSSTINALFGAKKTAVAATPGKTKHFQTLNINERLTLCDCPGLVLPKYAASKAEMVAAGAARCRAFCHCQGFPCLALCGRCHAALAVLPAPACIVPCPCLAVIMPVCSCLHARPYTQNCPSRRLLGGLTGQRVCSRREICTCLFWLQASSPSTG